MASFVCSCLLFSAVALAQSSFSPARPPAIPLAVRSPYLNTWLQVGSDGGGATGGNGGQLPGIWPTFWGGAVTGWTGLIKVDNATYTWMGAPVGVPSLATQTSFEYTSTKSMFSLSVGSAIALNITFLSPVTPNDAKRQSIPVSYMSVSVSSLDGKEHDVHLYTDVSAEWASGDRSAIAQWNYGTVGGSTSSLSRRSRRVRRQPVSEVVSPYTENPYKTFTRSSRSHHSETPAVTAQTSTEAPASTTQTPSSPVPSPTTLTNETSSAASGTESSAPAPTGTASAGGVAYHKFYRQNQVVFQESSDQPNWGNWYYATNNVAGLSHQSGADVSVRGLFVNGSGVLNDTEDTNFRAINDAFPVFAFAVNFGSVGSTPVDSLFTLVLAQSESIQFEAADGNVTVPSLWTSYYSNDLDLVSFAHGDYGTVSGLATTLDNKVASDSAAAAGQNYTIVTTLAVRQAWGALNLCGTPDQMYLFLKEISSDGDVQTVDVIYPFFPILLYMNPSWLKLMLDPLFINQEAGYWPFEYPIHDLGFYPNAVGHNDGNDEQQPLEEAGNMLIMTLAYSQRTGDTDYLTQHYDILNQWTQFLVQEALIPANQISTDDFAGSLANQTNLALKGIIGIQAMSVIANETGHASDGANFSSIAHSYIDQWQNLAIARNASPPHTTLAYGQENTHGLLYNLYADALLNTQLVPQSVYTMQSNFYPTVANEYGVPLDTRHQYTKSDWEMFCAAIAAPATRDLFIGDLAKWINETPTNRAMTDLFDTKSGDYPSGITFTARPVVGGFFALLALNGTSPLSG